jgi:hypothetical protein
MRAPGTAATIILGLSVGMLGLLTALKRRDERYVDGIRRALDASTSEAEPGRFSEEMVAGLPDPARRYFLHAIRPGTPLASHLYWHYTASMQPGRGMPWMALEAEQILVKEHGFVWKATARKGPLVVTVRDHYRDGEGRMRVALFGLVPVVNASGHDVAKSALGRLLIEGAGLPSAFLPGPHVRVDGVDDSHFTVTMSLHGETSPITLTVDPDGRLVEVAMQRWGNLTEDGSYQYIPYGIRATEERAFGGYTIPTRLAGGWWYGADNYLEVIRLNVDWARHD